MFPEFYMNQALAEARQAYDSGEIPVGAVIVKDHNIIGRGHNRTEELKNPLAHAEMIAIQQALNGVGGWRLVDCDLYVTLEPCAMCAGALVHARIRNVYIGTPDLKTGACGSVMNILQNGQLNHKAEIKMGIRQQECELLLKTFFKELRRKKR